MVFTALDWHEEIPSRVDGAHQLLVKSENAGEVALRDEIDRAQWVWRAGFEQDERWSAVENLPCLLTGFSQCYAVYLQYVDAAGEQFNGRRLQVSTYFSSIKVRERGCISTSITSGSCTFRSLG